jgi:hypothetical protein
MDPSYGEAAMRDSLARSSQVSEAPLTYGEKTLAQERRLSYSSAITLGQNQFRQVASSI